jgi:hypothetical protein
MRAIYLLLPLLAACATSPSASLRTPRRLSPAPVSPAFAPIVQFPARDGKALLAELDAAGNLTRFPR